MKTYAQRMKKPQFANPRQNISATAQISNQAMLGMLNEPQGDTRFSKALRARFEANPQPHSEHATPSKLAPEIMQKAEERYQVPLDGLKVFQDTGLQDSGFNGYAQGNEVHLDSKLSPTEHERVALHEIGHVVQRGSGTAYGSGFVDNSTLEHQADTGFVAGQGFSMPTNATGPVMGDPANFPRLEQEGPTCGIYALAMALMSLYPPEGGFKKDGDYKAEGKKIADAIKQKVIENNLSSIGEFYDANMLCAAANEYPNQSDYKVTAEVKEFNSSEDLNDILRDAQSKDQRVLIAFAATDEGESSHAYPVADGSSLEPHQMTDAHWCVLNTFDSLKKDHQCCKLSQKPDESYVGIREGWNSRETYKTKSGAPHSRVSVQTLFDSNQRLNEIMDWTQYIKGNAKTEDGTMIETRLRDRNIIDQRETVKLKGKVVVVARNDGSEIDDPKKSSSQKKKTCNIYNHTQRRTPNEIDIQIFDVQQCYRRQSPMGRAAKTGVGNSPLPHIT